MKKSHQGTTHEKRPGPFAQDPSRTSPTKEQREKDYQLKKKIATMAIG